MNQQATISGSYLETLGGMSSSDTEGIYARDSNSGSYSQNRFAFIPEFNIDMIYALTCNLDLKFGTTISQAIEVLYKPAYFPFHLIGPGTIPEPNHDDQKQTFSQRAYKTVQLQKAYQVDYEHV